MSTLHYTTFSEAFEDVSRGNTKVPEKQYQTSGELPVVDQGATKIPGFTDNISSKVNSTGPHIIFGDHTRNVKYIDFPFAIGADGVKVLRARTGFDAKFLYHFLRWKDIPSAGYSRHFKFLKELQVPSPPLSEQRRIVVILDHAVNLRNKYQLLIDSISELKISSFVSTFGHPLANERGFATRRISDLADVVTGNSPSRNDPENFGSSTEWIKSDNLGGEIATEAKVWLSEKGRSKARLAPEGSVLVTCIAGSAESIGKCSIIEREVAFNQQINAILPGGNILPEFLLAQLKCAPELVRHKSTGGMKGLVNKSTFQGIEVLVPPRELQEEYVASWRTANREAAAASKARDMADIVLSILQDRAYQRQP